MNNTDYKPEIRARLKAVRAFHPAPWRVVSGTLIDAESNPIDFDLPAVRQFFQHLLGDLESLTESERRRSVTRDLSAPTTGLRRPSRSPASDSIPIDVISSMPPRRRK